MSGTAFPHPSAVDRTPGTPILTAMKRIYSLITLVGAGLFLGACEKPESAPEATPEDAPAAEEATQEESAQEETPESAAAPSNESSGDGWVSLFDGETLDGWHPSTIGTATYSVVDGAIRGETAKGSPNTFLISDGEYADFELEFEVKVHDNLNSGCQIRSREKTEEDLAGTGRNGEDAKDTGRFFGPQVEIESSPGQSGYIYGEATGRGWLSPEPREKSHSHDLVKNGEWNQFRVVARGPRIQTFINGEQVADLTDEAIHDSHPKGHLGLQVHGIPKDKGPYDVSWRNIRIREISE